MYSFQDQKNAFKSSCQKDGLFLSTSDDETSAYDALFQVARQKAGFLRRMVLLSRFRFVF